MGKKTLSLLSVLLLYLMTGAFNVNAKTVYFDNSETNWPNPHIYYWVLGSDYTTTTWPGVTMRSTQYEGIWSMEIDDMYNGIIFNNHGSPQTSNLTPVADHVYTLEGDTHKTLTQYLNLGGGGEEGGGGDEPNPDGIYVYAKVPSDWTNLYVYVYSEKTSPTIFNHAWPGEPMTWDSVNEQWEYQLPDNLTYSNVIFVSTDNPNNRYPADSEPGLEVNNVSMTFTYSGSGTPEWEEKEEEPVDPSTYVPYTVHFYNNVDWNNVYIRISGIRPAINTSMSSFLNSATYDYSFEGPEEGLRCAFYTLVNGQQTQLSPYFELIDGHIYTISGDKGLNTEFDPSALLPEKEFWLEPERPSVKAKATLYFNRAYKSSCPLKNSDDIYVYCGLVAENEYTGNSNEHWYGNLDNSNYPSEKFRLKQDATHPDLFYIEFEPSIDQWFGGVDLNKSYSKIGLIFKNGNNTLTNGRQYVDIRPLAPVGDSLGQILNWEENEDHSISITSENGTLQITPWSKEVVKVFTLPHGASNTTERPSISVIDNDLKEAYGIKNIRFNKIEDGSEYLRLTISGGVKVIIEKSTSLISFYNYGADTETLEERGGLVNRPGNISVTFQEMDDLAFYGGGYNGNLINWEGNTMKMNNNQQGGWYQGQALDRNICIPFYISTNGYGVYFDDHYKDAEIVPSKSGSSYSSRSEDPIAYYFIGGGDVVSVMQNYTTLTGRQELPPYWALGYITSKFGFATDTEAKEAITKTKECNIPIDGIVFDINWQSGLDGANGVTKMGKIDWDRSAYSRTYSGGPTEMMKDFRDTYNVHTIAITEPYFTSNSGNYDYLNNNGLLADDNVSGMEWLHSSKVGLLDITNPQAIDWFKDLYKKRTLEGIESWWLDLGEPEKHDWESTYLDGNYNQIHNEYSVRWNKLAYDAVKEATPDTRFITMPRAGTSGMQHYNAFPWTGDIQRSWGGLAAQVPALVSASMSGVSYLGSDIGGFTAYGTDANLYRRWVQLGVFYPSMRTHSATAPEVWQPDYNSIRDDVRNAINLRYAYLPYTYSQAYAYTAFGTPIARPANYNDTDKSVLSNEIGAYYWGPDIFVAPVLDNSTSKNITFPEGDWLDMNDFKTIYSGHQNVRYSAPTNVLPHFMRRGAFVARFAQDTFSSTAEIDHSRLIVDYFADHTNREVLSNPIYQDDMTTVDPISTGNYIITRFETKHIDHKSLAITIKRYGNGWEGMPETQDIIFRIHDFHVTDDGSDLPEDMVKLIYCSDDHKARGKFRVSSGFAEDDADSLNKKSSVEEVMNESSNPSYYHDTDSNTMYLRLPTAYTTHHYGLSMGQPSIPTGVYTTTTDENLELEYSIGSIRYCAVNTENLSLDIFAISGERMAHYSDLEADGNTKQIELNLNSGVYIAILKAIDNEGVEHSKTCKIML